MVHSTSRLAVIYKKPFFLQGAFWVLLILAVAWGISVHAQEADKKQSVQGQIDALEKEVAEIDGRLQDIQSQTKSLSREVEIFNNEIKKKQLELKRIGLAIRQADIDIATKSSKIDEIS